MEEGGIGKEGQLVRVVVLQEVNQLPEAGKEGRLTVTGKGDVVNLRLVGEVLLKLPDHSLVGNVLGPYQGLLRSRPYLTVETVHAADFIGDQVNPQGETKPSGEDRPKYVLHFSS